MRFVTITSPDVNNGQGNRATCWISGCGHKCDGCHNKWLQDYLKGHELYLAKERIWEELSKPYIMGITFSGGDPLYQSDDSLDELFELISNIRNDFPEKDIWLYSGFTLEELVAEGNKHRLNVLYSCNYFVDGKFMKDKKNVQLPFRGSSNQHIWRLSGEREFEHVDDEYFQS